MIPFAAVPAVFQTVHFVADEISRRSAIERAGQPCGLACKTSAGRGARARTPAAPSGLALKYSTKTRAGSLLCPGVDIDKYRELCRAPLFADHWNFWRVVRSTKSGLEPSKMADKTLAFMSYLSNELKGRIPKVDVLAPGTPDNPWGTPAIVTRQNVCAEQSFTLEHSSHAPAFLVAYVRFIYRGVEASVPWPAIKQSLAGAVTHDCPNDATWLLDTVYAPSKIDVPPPEADPFLPPWVEKHRPRTPGEWDLSTKIAIGGGVVIVIAAVAGYAVRSFR